MSLKTIEEQLPSGKFIRVHKSYIVSVNYITAVMKNSIFIGELELPVGDLYRMFYITPPAAREDEENQI